MDLTREESCVDSYHEAFKEQNHQGVEAQSSSEGRHRQSEEHDQGDVEAGNNHEPPSFHERKLPNSESVSYSMSSSRDYLADDPQNGRETSALCDYCKEVVAHAFEDIYFEDYWRSPRLQHCENILKVEEMATAGCSLCTQFLLFHVKEEHNQARQLTEQIFEDDLIKIQGYVEIQHHSDFDDDSDHSPFDDDYVKIEDVHAWDMELKFLTTRLDAEENGDEFKSLMVTMIPNPQDTGASTFLGESNTKDSLPLLGDWIKTCLALHSSCNDGNMTTTPSRLLSILDDKVRVCLSAQFDACPPYATLSHCWGSFNLPKLLGKNFRDLQAEVPIESLSETFKDAICIAREVGIGYIWIDSLCIVQDDDEDWKRESAKMGGIYEGSTLNIAASHAKDGSRGCFIRRDAQWRCRIETKFQDRPIQLDCVPAALGIRHILDEPLARRGWALQERVLARRTVHFTSTELFWECNESVACETFPGGIPLLLRPSIPLHHLPLKRRPVDMSMWPALVSRYSDCELTYVKDRLPAISGLARLIQAQTGDEYLAGLWKSALISELCWSVGETWEPRALSLHAHDDRFPSWSWISSNRGVTLLPFESENEAYKASVVYVVLLDVNIVLSGVDPFGEIVRGNLLLGCLVFLKCSNPQTLTREYSISIYDKRWTGTLFFDSSEKPLGDFYILPVTGKPQTLLTGLLLQQTGISRGQYKRIGVFQFSPHFEIVLTSGTFPVIHGAIPEAADVEDTDYIEVRNLENGGLQCVIEII